MNIKDKLSSLGIKIQEKKKDNSADKEDLLLSNFEGKICENEFGRFFKIEIKYELPYNFGNYQFKKMKIAEISQKYFGLEESSDFVFIDTETTGLSSGTGTYAFLIGLGFFEKEFFVINQYFMIDLNFEKAILHEFKKQIEEKVIVSFNGKSFDLTLINNRMKMNNMDIVDNKVHLDILHISRRIWRNQFKSYKLGYLEYKLFNFLRTEYDIEGELIPKIYGYFLNHNDISDLGNIFYHNQIDILTLAVLFDKITNIIDYKKIEYESEYFSLGRIYRKFSKEMAIEILEEGKKIVKSEKIYKEILHFLADIFKRDNQIELAVENWNILAKLSDSRAVIELAKYYEHTEKNYKKALEILEIVDFKEKKKRVERLKKKYDNSKNN